MSESRAGRIAVVLGAPRVLARDRQDTRRERHDVYLSGRTQDSANAAVEEIGQGTIGLAVDLAMPRPLRRSFERAVGRRSDHRGYRARRQHLGELRHRGAVRLVTLKLVGYTEAVHALRGRLTPQASIVLFGAWQHFAPTRSTTVSTVNGGIVGIVNSLATELAPIRVNAIHPASSVIAPSGRARTTVRDQSHTAGSIGDDGRDR